MWEVWEVWEVWEKVGSSNLGLVARENQKKQLCLSNSNDSLHFKYFPIFRKLKLEISKFSFVGKSQK
ncbi:MAG: hypothetical protein F6K22_10365 [Okeania sp. SIO2F4]|nr:hypothetical protein [Okeania sp. SIO2F4]